MQHLIYTCSDAVVGMNIKVYRTAILPVVLYGCETWSLTFREDHVLRKIHGVKKDWVTGMWRRLQNQELCGLHFLLYVMLLV